jgi:hypothetical protein
MTFSKLVATSFAVAALAVPAASRAQDAKPGEFKIPGTESTIKFYGYVQLDTTFDFNGRNSPEEVDYATVISTVPLQNSREAKVGDKQLYLTARTSRFGVQTNTPTGIGPISVKLEGDFNGVNAFQGESFTNSVLFRLRHAYGQADTKVGTFLVGQTWTNFIDLASYPDVVDFNGPGSIALVRQPQARFTANLAPGMSLAVAVENAPGFRFSSDGSGVTFGDNQVVQSIPDFSANLGFSGAWGSASVRGITTNRKQVNDAGTDTVSKQGYGGAVSGAFKLGADTLVAHAVYGAGIARYIFNVGTANGPVAVATDGSGDLVNIEAGAYHVGFTHVWSPAFRSNLVWSQTFIQNPEEKGVDFRNTTTNRRMDQAFVNSFWTVAKNMEIGLEYDWGRRTTFDGQHGLQNRVTGTFHYNFF